MAQLVCDNRKAMTAIAKKHGLLASLTTHWRTTAMIEMIWDMILN
jgi:transposase-like protein